MLYRLGWVLGRLSGLWRQSRGTKCLRKTMKVLDTYDKAYVAFSDAQDAFIASRKRYDDDLPLTAESNASIQKVYFTMMSQIVAIRKIIAKTKIPTCLENVRAGDLRSMGAPSTLEPSDLINLVAHMQKFQIAMLTFMDSAYECLHKETDEDACNKADEDGRVAYDILVAIENIKKKGIEE